MKNIRRIVFVVVAAMTAVVSAAQTLSPEEALNRALHKSTLKTLSNTKAEKFNLIHSSTYNGLPTYYVFQAPNRTIFVGAQTASDELLGYIENGDFDISEACPPLKWWLSQYDEQIVAAANDSLVVSLHATTQSAETLLESDAVQAGRIDIDPLCKTSWSQSAPYNNLCPTIGDERCCTGCVATAMAQIIKYYEYPIVPEGDIDYTTETDSLQLSLNLSTLTFDYENMLDKYTQGSYTDAQGDAVAQLMMACGYSVEMNYGLESSGASDRDAAKAFMNNFGYSKSMSYYERTFYSTAEWENLLYENLYRRIPILYGGRTTNEGHMFICDGYNSADGLFHFNWGWGGNYDGYFTVDPSNSDGNYLYPRTDVSEGFTQSQVIVLGIEPDPDSTSVASPAFIASSAPIDAINYGVKLEMTGRFYNRSIHDGVFDLGLRFEAPGLESIEQPSRHINDKSLKSWRGYTSFSVTVPEEMRDVPSFTVTPIYRLTGDTVWIDVRAAEGVQSSITVLSNEPTDEFEEIALGVYEYDKERELMTSCWDENIKLDSISLGMSRTIENHYSIAPWGKRKQMTFYWDKETNVLAVDPVKTGGEYGSSGSIYVTDYYTYNQDDADVTDDTKSYYDPNTQTFYFNMVYYSYRGSFTPGIETFKITSTGINEVESLTADNGIVYVYNAWGQLVMTKPAADFQLSHIEGKGLYIIRQGNSVKKILK